MSEIKGGQFKQPSGIYYIIQPTIAFVSVCMAKIQYVSSTNS